jgi:hypothetical protein
MSQAIGRLACGLLVCATLLSVIASGCSNTSTGPQAPDDPYPARTSPDSVLAKLNLAYVAMDADAYLDCLADSFFFHLRFEDCDDPWDPLPPYWNRDKEQEIHEAMFDPEDTLGVDRVDLTLTPIGSEFDPGEPGDPYDNRWTYVVDVDLRVGMAEWTFLANCSQEFVFAIESVRGDTLWQMSEWYELSDEESARVESSWGTIKAQFGLWLDHGSKQP